MDGLGNRGFSGAADAARGQALQGAVVLILMGDWCATATPTFENQVCGDTCDRQMDEIGKNAGKVAEVWFSLLTETANG